MPGVSSNESNEIIAQLQEVGQIISQESSQLVDALMNLTLDQEDTDKAIARMGLEASLMKAETEDKAQTIRDLRGGLESEKKKREQAENDVKEVMSELQVLTGEFKRLKEKAAMKDQGEGSDGNVRDDLIKVCFFCFRGLLILTYANEFVEKGTGTYYSPFGGSSQQPPLALGHETF